ncbi:IclR family transcriptional regulator [Dethiosulfovibrio marinus]|uniref:IclR family transcriptional regulator n=1 Tax=Dethiosulfovibrio marinus TaxID=133532 RepID=A0ABS9EM26_9BACT|nr:IclR family transcriptional regulator [Dethiosulfovibrio marinus]MCF4142249.1 IclR family transcriptional regulator [Dethiosulfovibrio marinus]
MKYSLQILDYLEGKESGVSLADICRAVEINKSRAMRLCGTMEHMGYLVLRQEGGVYSLGPRLLSLGKAFERNNPMIRIVKPVLRNMVIDLEETVSFQVIRNDRRMCISAVESPHPVRYTMVEGSEGEFPSGASSKVLLAWGPEKLREEVFERAPYERHTPNTITTLEELKESIAKTLDQGYILSFEERSLGSAALAVPVFGSEGSLVGAICVSGVLERMSKEFLRMAVPYSIERAKELSRMFGCSNSFIE